MQAKLRFHAAPVTAVFLAVAVVVAVVALVALSGAKAAGQGQPQCGDTITADTTLHKDLVNYPNNGILIGADDVTLDLNYHTIDGDGTPAAGCDPTDEVCDTGVVNDGHDGVTVMHGQVREFGVGVLLGTSTPGRVRHNQVLGISSLRNSSNAIVVFDATRSLVRNSSGIGSMAPDTGAGLLLGESRHVRIVRNSFRHNGDMGIAVDFHSADNLIKGNLLAHNRNFGIVLREEAARNRVRRNRSVRNGVFGIYVAPGNRNVIARNRIFRAGESGIQVDGGERNVIARNLVRDTEGPGINIDFEGTPVVGNVVRRNHVSGAREDGVRVNAGAKHTHLRSNRARDSKDDGFDVASRSAKLTKNRGLRNADLGIEAVRGVIDGGGNIARHNGDPRQCTNITCS